jgi:LysR family glycine cleavage system transcriptional activator
MTVRRLPPLKSLRAFEAAARHLSFTRAAGELFVTQAAVSHQVKALEEFLGVALFFRRNKRLMLTDEGKAYWPRIRDIFETLRAATDEVRTLGAQGSLTVSVLPTFATAWLVPRLSQFKQLHPDIDVRINANDMPVNFVDDDVDVAIDFRDNEADGIYSVTLLNETLTPVCSPELIKETPLDKVEDLEKHTFLHDDSTDDWRRWLRLAGVKGVNLKQGSIFSHTAMVQQAAIHAQGVAMGRSVLCEADIKAGRLIKPFDLEMESTYSYNIICLQQSSTRPRVSAFIEWLLETVKSESG